MSGTLRFVGSAHFRTRLVLSTLTGLPIRIDDIRHLDPNPGLRPHEADLLRLLERISNGCRVEINETGTSVRYRPGVLTCGTSMTFDAGGSGRAVGYFLWAIAVLAPFAKKRTGITFRGITGDELDANVDVFRTVTIPVLKNFGIEENIEIKILKRGCPPNGGGEVLFNCPNIRQTKPVDLTNPGMVKRIRGIAYSTRVSPQMANRMVDSARSVLNAFIPDIYIYTDHFKGAEAGNSPGFGLSLVAESDTGALVSSDACADGPTVPEDIGVLCANRLCEEISSGGYVDAAHQGLVMILMAFGPEDVSKLRVGPLSEHAVATLRHIKAFSGVSFKMAPDRNSGTVLLSCLGSGFINYAKKTQ